MSDHINQHIAALLAQADDLTGQALAHTRNAAHALSRAQVARETAADLKAMLDVPAPPAFDYRAVETAQRDPHAREVQHIDTPDEEPAGIPPHVWLYRNMLTDLQALAPLGRDDTNGQYAVAIDQLTDEQRAIPHVSKQVSAYLFETARDYAAGCVLEENGIVRREGQ